MVFCSNCGADVEEHQKFCPECGTKLERAEQPTTSPPPPPSAEPEIETTFSAPPPPPPPPPAGSQSNIPPSKQGVLERLDIDQEDIEEATEKAKKGLGMLGRLARRGLEKGAELASHGIEVAKDTIEERRASSDSQPAPAYAPAPTYAPAPVEGSKFCPSCGQSVSGPGKFCNNCGQKLE